VTAKGKKFHCSYCGCQVYTAQVQVIGGYDLCKWRHFVVEVWLGQKGRAASIEQPAAFDPSH